MNIPDHIDTSIIADQLRQMPDDQLSAMFIHVVGGPDVYEAMRHRVANPGVGSRQLADWVGVPEATLRSWINRARVRCRTLGIKLDRLIPEPRKPSKLRQLGLMPPEWEKTSSRHEASSSTDKA